MSSNVIYDRSIGAGDDDVVVKKSLTFSPINSDF